MSTDVDNDLLDFEDHFSSPSSFYAGTGGKPPLAFSIDKPSRKRLGITVASKRGSWLIVLHYVKRLLCSNLGRTRKTDSQTSQSSSPVGTQEPLDIITVVNNIII